MPSRIIIVTISVDDFLVAAERPIVIYKFAETLKKKYIIKHMGRPTRYLGWHFNYESDYSVSLSQRLLIDQTQHHTGVIDCNGKMTPYPIETI